jgi:adenylate cyclase class 1
MTTNEDNEFLITQYRRFLESAINRRNMMQSDTDINMDMQLECYQINISNSGKYGLKKISPQEDSTLKKYLGIQVIGDATDETRSKLTLFCDGREFSTLEYGENLFREVASHVLERRKGGERYPIYITDIDVSPAFLGLDGKHKPQTIHFLNHKKLIETKLNNAMHAL